SPHLAVRFRRVRDSYLHVTEKRNKKRRKILLDAARPVLAYVQRAGIGDDKEGPLFRPMTPDATRLIRRHLDRKTPWRRGRRSARYLFWRYVSSRPPPNRACPF